MNISDLKTLLISRKNKVNPQLRLNKTKDIKYTESKYFDEISFLSLFNCRAEDGSDTMNFLDDVPCGAALLQQLKKLGFDSVEEQFHELFVKQFYEIFPKAKNGKKYKAVIIIDNHEQETYSKEKRTHNNIRGGKHKNGTNFFFKYTTMQVLIKDKIITLRVRFYSRENHQRRLNDELIRLAKKFVKIKVVLLDREFRDAKLLNNLEYRQAPVFMPVVKDKKAKKCFEDLGQSPCKVVKFWISNDKGEIADVKLMMIRLSNGKEIGFYTTVHFPWLHTINHYLSLYKKRWNIETGYRLQNMFLPKTTSIDEIVRMFYFCYACAMHNLWLLIRPTTKISKRFTVLKMKIIVLMFWIATHLPKNW
jgi:hypothetical protein